MIGARITPIPKIDIASPRFSFGKLSTIIACVIGRIPPPPKPCNTLANIINSIFFAIPQSIEAKVNINMLIIKKFLRPKTLLKKSTAGITIPAAIK